jgi:hemoglobin/transferrin/lactoferrin receptor protein
VNLRDVVISGFEASVTWVPVKAWHLSAAYAHARGDQDDGSGRTPLRSIDPDKLALSARWQPGAAWGAEAAARFVKRKTRNPNPAGYNPPGYGVLDLSAWWEIHRHASLNLVLNNVLDKKYTEWADVRDLAATSTLIDAYTQPGRNVSASVQVRF